MFYVKKIYWKIFEILPHQIPFSDPLYVIILSEAICRLNRSSRRLVK